MAFDGRMSYADYLGLGDNLSLSIAIATGFTVRALAIRYDWSLPGPKVRPQKG